MYKMNRMVIVDGIRYKPADAERLGHKAMAPAAPIGSFAKPAPLVEEEPEDEVVAEPSKSGAKSAWIDFAKSLGATDDQLDGMSRDELAETYGA